MKTYINLGISIICCLSFTSHANSSSSAAKNIITKPQTSMSPSDAYELASQHHKIGEFKEAAEYVLIAANAKNAKGQTLLAFMYLQGQGVGQSDSKAKYYYQLASDQGYAPAQARLGFMYQTIAEEEFQI